MGLTRCVECARPVADRHFRGSHWLCEAHRRERGARVGAEESEAELLERLVYDFPESCRYDLFRARMMYARDVWCTADKAREVCRAHGLAVRVTRRVTKRDVQGLVHALVAFVCRHLHLAPASLGEACVRRVRELYPRLACAETRQGRMRGERTLAVLEGATGVREFLVLSDVARGLGAVLPRDAVELVYAAYVRSLWSGPVVWGGGGVALE
jgi:hypothetical protein